MSITTEKISAFISAGVHSLTAELYEESQIPEADARLLAATFLQAAKRFYSDPENRKRAEIWIREQEAKKAEKK